jgi:hypothetical protein
MPLPKIQIKANPEELVLLINDHVHLHLVGKVKSVQGWIESEVWCEYCINWRFDDYVETTKYWDKKLWLRILDEYKMKVVKVK